MIIAVIVALFAFVDLGPKGELRDASRNLVRGKEIVLILRGQTCSVVQGGSKEFFCSFEFPFRSDEARILYDDYVLELKVSHSGNEYVEWSEGVPLNHPDSYEQTIFDHYKGAQFFVALKDKGTLQNTYVFVRLPAN
ncbi:MAG: hypothetical protein QNK92_11800 [Amylibacter sp.]